MHLIVETLKWFGLAWLAFALIMSVAMVTLVAVLALSEWVRRKIGAQTPEPTQWVEARPEEESAAMFETEPWWKNPGPGAS